MKEFLVPGRTDRIRYHDLPGGGVPIVFIHGLGCASSMDYPNVATQTPLASHRRILVDLLGAGFSDKPDDFGYAAEDHAAYLLQFVESLKLSAFVLFGHSMGGAVAISFAQLCPECIRHLVLTESNLDPSPESAVSNQIASQSMQEFVQTGFDSMIARAVHAENTLWAASLSLWSPIAAYRFSQSGKNGGRIDWRQTLYALALRYRRFSLATDAAGRDETELPTARRAGEIVPQRGSRHGLGKSMGFSGSSSSAPFCLASKR